jgi:hypothetical protein
MIKNAVICDECSEERKETNHWWIVQIAGDRPSFMCWPWDVGQHLVTARHYCGQSCVLKAMERWMSEQVAEGKNGN